MKTYYDRTYYTFDDIDKIANPTKTDKGPFAMKLSPDMWFASIMKIYGSSFGSFGSTYLTDCWTKYIWPRFWNQYVCFVDGDTTDTDAINSFVENIEGQIVAWMKTSDDKYSLLIKNQEDNKSKLLGQIKSSNISRFNDTPQNQGAYDDDAHNTTTTKNESATDGGTLLSRLNEVEDNLKRLYEDWSNEFRKFIIWSVQ